MSKFTQRGLSAVYAASGCGAEALLVLPGALGGGNAVLSRFEEIAGSRRLLTLDTWPRAGGMAELLDWLEALFEAEGVERWVVYGGSFGGLVAQCLVRRFPEHTRALILSGTGAPDSAQARSNRRVLRLLPWLPMPLVRGALGLLLRLVLARVGREREHVRAAYRPLVDGLERADLESRYRLAIDFAEAHRFTPGDLADWPGSVLLLEGEGDRVASLKVREALRALYPQAETHTFRGAGHAAALAVPEEWAAVVGGFLNRL